jgi:hypothetical protein
MRCVGLLLILIGATSTVVLAQQASEDNGAPIIRDLEHEWLEAQAHNDNHTLDLIFDNALVYIEEGKLMTKGEYLSRIRTASPNPQSIVMEPITVHNFGSTAIVVGTFRGKSVNSDNSSVRRWRFIDTWVNKQGHWVLVAAAASPLSK